MFKSLDSNELVLADFGFAKRLDDKDQLNTTPCGTGSSLNYFSFFPSDSLKVLYVAPEVINKSYNQSADIWSIGCSAFFILFGIPPFYSIDGDEEEVLRKIENYDGILPFPEEIEVTATLKHFLENLLHPNKDKRLNAQEALVHPWLNVESGIQSPSVLSSSQKLKRIVLGSPQNEHQKLLRTLEKVIEKEQADLSPTKTKSIVKDSKTRSFSAFFQHSF